jgi:hypothetical protein
MAAKGFDFRQPRFIAVLPCKEMGGFKNGSSSVSLIGKKPA